MMASSSFTRSALVLSLVYLLQLTDPCQSLQMINVEVPRYQTVGGRARLICNYDLGKESLYSVKWYKEGKEFYRYVPGDQPPWQVFNVSDITVDQPRSGEHVVFLRDLTMNTSGRFVCEASSEAPFFKTVSGKGMMHILDLPDRAPDLRGAHNGGYRVGEWLDVNCSSPNSKPPAQLQWYINNEKVDPSYIHERPPFVNGRGLYTSQLRLRFQLKRAHFLQGHVNIKCTATVYKEYFESSEKHLAGLGLGEKALESRRTNAGGRLCPSFFAATILFSFSFIISSSRKAASSLAA